MSRSQRGNAPPPLETARERDARSDALKTLLSGLAIKPFVCDDEVDDDPTEDGGELSPDLVSPSDAVKSGAKSTSGPHVHSHPVGPNNQGTRSTPYRPFAGGGAILTSTGRPVVLSAGSRRLPAVFREQHSLVRDIDTALSNVQQTLKRLNYDFSKTKDTTLPQELLQAVDADHQTYLAALDVQKQLGGGGSLKGQRTRAAGAVAGGPADVIGSNSDNRHGYSERQWMKLVRQARDAAADEGFVETQSVENYAAEPDVPRSLQGQTLHTLLEHAEVDCAKFLEDLDALTVVTNSRDTIWWESALLTRDVKSHTVRGNYHARRAQRWVWRARESLMLQASYLNQFSSDNCKDLVRLQGQLESFLKRVQESEASTVALQKELVELQAQARTAVADRTRAQEEMVKLAHARGLLEVDEEDPLRAETLLLLQQFRWTPDVFDDVVRVMRWLHDHPVLLEV